MSGIVLKKRRDWRLTRRGNRAQIVGSLTKFSLRVFEIMSIGAAFSGEGQQDTTYNLEHNNCTHWANNATRIARILTLLPL